MIDAMFFKKPSRTVGEASVPSKTNKIRRKKLLVDRSSRSSHDRGSSVDSADLVGNGDIELEINPPIKEGTPDEEKDEAPPVVLTDSECEDKKKAKPKHRKTMSMSNTIDLVRSVGDEWFEAAKREIGEHSKKKESARKKKESLCHEQTTEKNDVVLLLSDATLGETDEFDMTMSKPSKKAKAKDSQVATQKMGVKMIARASTVSALNFIRKKRPAPIVDSDSSADHIILSTELFLDSERVHSDMVRPPDGVKPYLNGNFINDPSSKTATDEECEPEVFYDAKEDASEEEQVVSSESKPKSKEPKVIGSRTRKNFTGSLKRTGGGRRKVRRKSTLEDMPPIPPKAPPMPPPPPHKHSHWLFGSSFKGDGKGATDDGQDGHHHLGESWDKSFDHSTDRADHAVRQRPVTRAESYRDKAAKVQRTKRKTSDPNQLTSGNAYNDAEASGNTAAPSGASSSSSLSSRSNESAGQVEGHDSHSEWSDEEENTEPWSTQAPAELVATMSMQARKRQDLIHELITTERSHVRWLRILQRIFLSPLQHSKLLSNSEFRALFPNLGDVLQRHRKLRDDLIILAEPGLVVKTKPLAEALINTLGEPKFRIALAKFCVGQKLALEALREKQKRNKDLHALIAKCESDGRCARRRLPDILACVWQRLTKYPLLLEGIIKIGKEEDEVDAENQDETGYAKTKVACKLAKEILDSVNTAMKTAENEHKLRLIQSKLEIRGAGGTGGSESDPGELRRLDLTRHSLVMDGNLIIRQDSTKRLTVQALMLNECLVLLLKENQDRYILRPIPQGGQQPLSPVIHWNTVFFRENAAVKNGFFLVNINGRQMYDMSATNSSEYNIWIRYLSSAAKGLDHRSGPVEEGPPPPLPPNPPPVTATSQEEPPSGDPSEPNTSIEDDREETPQPQEGSDVGTSSTAEGDSQPKSNNVRLPPDDLVMISPASVDIVSPPSALTAHRQMTPEEQLRQAEQKVMLALQEAAEAAKEVINVPPTIYSAMDTLLGKSSMGNGAVANVATEETSTKNLLLTAISHVDNLTEVLFRALRVPPANCSMSKCSIHTGHGLCDTCHSNHSKFLASSKRNSRVDSKNESETEVEVGNSIESDASTVKVAEQHSHDLANNRMDSFVMLEAVGESSTDPGEESDSQLVAASSMGLREILATLVQRLPAEEQERELLRARLQQADQRIHRLHHIHRDCAHSEDVSTDNNQEVPISISTDEKGGG